MFSQQLQSLRTQSGKLMVSIYIKKKLIDNQRQAQEATSGCNHDNRNYKLKPELKQTNTRGRKYQNET